MQQLQKLLEERDRFEALADLLDREAAKCPLENQSQLLELAKVIRGVVAVLKWSTGNRYSASLTTLLQEAGIFDGARAEIKMIFDAVTGRHRVQRRKRRE